MTLEQVVRLPTWRRHAACRGRGDLFYATDDVSQRVALAVCAACGVRRDCLAEALADEQGDRWSFGVRGGLVPGERRRLLCAR